MKTIAYVFIATPIVLFTYAYVAYPALLWVMAARKSSKKAPDGVKDWPFITITLPVYNEAQTIREKIESLLAMDYPPEKRQILVISDASNDRTDEIVASFTHKGLGVELLRLRERRGKTAAENAAWAAATGDIIINTDATVRLLPHSIKALVAAFEDPTVGVASGRDVNISTDSGETSYVGYEMRIRASETRVRSIVGASGCFYGIRRSLYDPAFPEHLSRDFAAALVVNEAGLRAVSVKDAVCQVPCTDDLAIEQNRKIRTMARGLATLWYKRSLMNPYRYGIFAWMLASHKLARWLIPITLPLLLIGLAILSIHSWIALAMLAMLVILAIIGYVTVYRQRGISLPKPAAIIGFILVANLAGILAWSRFLWGQSNAVWEPTRRTA